MSPSAAENNARVLTLSRIPSTRALFLQTSKHTPHPSALTRASDFLGAYCLGFAVEDAIAMLRLEELYIVSPRLIPFFYRPSLT